MKKKQASKRTNKKAFVRDTAATLFMKHGYHGTSMDHVAEKTGLNKGTLYFYYKSKSEILFEIYDLCGTAILARISARGKPTPPLEAVQALIKDIVLSVCERPVETTVYFREEPWLADTLDAQQLKSVYAKQKAVWTFCQGVFKRAIRSGALREFAVEDCYHALLGMTSWVHRWIKAHDSPDDVADRLSEILLNGLKAT